MEIFVGGSLWEPQSGLWVVLWDSAWTDRLSYRTFISCLKISSRKNLMVSGELAGFCAQNVFPSLKIPSHSLPFCFLQNVFNMVVEVPRWTNAKMEVTTLHFQS